MVTWCITPDVWHFDAEMAYYGTCQQELKILIYHCVKFFSFSRFDCCNLDLISSLDMDCKCDFCDMSSLFKIQ